MSNLPNTVMITIGNTVINFPSSGASPNWAPAVIDFAVAVEGALAGVIGPSDVPPQTLALDPYNPGTSINIPNLAFSTTITTGAFIRYTVTRSTTTTTVVEAGQLTIDYNPTNASGSKWEIGRTYTSDAQISFYVTDVGQVQFTTATLAGLNHSGFLTYAASTYVK